MTAERAFPEFWRRRGVLNAALLPLGGLFFAAVAARRALFRVGILRAARLQVPVVVVGNIVAGGGGKTPLVAALAEKFREAGMSPGIVSRGFGRKGGKAKAPMTVEADSDWRQCGDEPLMLRRKTGLPVCVCPNRPAAAQALARRGCDVIISDDGLQHLALARDAEICALQADYQNGNGWPLPAGPLREPAARIRRCDIVAVLAAGDEKNFPEELKSDSRAMRIELRPAGFFAVDSPESRFSESDLREKRTVAFAGIARPARFFAELKRMGIRPEVEIPLPDHGRLPAGALAGIPAGHFILTTEKDAVKYGGERRLLALETRAILPPQFFPAVMRKIGEQKTWTANS